MEPDLEAIAREVQALLIQNGLEDFPRSSAVLLGVLAVSIAEQSRGDHEFALELCAGLSAELLKATGESCALERRNASLKN